MNLPNKIIFMKIFTIFFTWIGIGICTFSLLLIVPEKYLYLEVFIIVMNTLGAVDLSKFILNKNNES